MMHLGNGDMENSSDAKPALSNGGRFLCSLSQ